MLSWPKAMPLDGWIDELPLNEQMWGSAASFMFAPSYW